MKKRGFIVGDTLVWWIVAIAVLVAGVVLFLMIKGRGESALEFFKDLWRFR